MILALIIAIIYLGIGFALMLWIRRDNEFREWELGEMLAYVSIVLWPMSALLYVGLRPEEQLDDLAAKKTYQDFKNFMRQRKRGEGDLFAKLDKQTSPGKPLEIADARDEYRDYHLEDLINQKKWFEALRTANDMLRFAREQQEYTRAAAYESYIREIKDKRREDSA